MVTAHYAIASMFHRPGDGDLTASYEIKPIDDVRLESGRARLAVGTTSVRSRVTREQQRRSFGVLPFGDHDLMAGIRLYPGEPDSVHRPASCASRLKTPISRGAASLRSPLWRRYLFPKVALPRRAPESRQKAPGFTMAEAEAAYGQNYQTMLP